MNGVDTPTLLGVAREHGAATAGVSKVGIMDRERAKLVAHKANGMSGPLRFTYADPDIATEVSKSFPWARSIVTLGVGYLGETSRPAPTGAVVGRFAASDNYAGVRGATAAVASALENVGASTAILIDDNRLVDRGAAVRSGAGWQGKSTMVLTPGSGPWLLFGSVVTDHALEPTPPMRRDCGTCVACIPACPTGAIGEAGLDARRCISTWLQTAGSLPHWIRGQIGRRIYGCDDCLTSCPPGAKELAIEGNAAEPLPFAELLAHTDEQLLERFHWWYVPRRNGRFIRRNLLVAAGNSHETEALPQIRQHLTHRSSMIRGHASWALARSIGSEAIDELQACMESETVPEAISELEFALDMVKT